jgi:signal transduction histidine kinase
MRTADVTGLWERLSLAARFAIASALILVLGAAFLGTWIAREIETSVIRRVAADSALYVEALVGPHVQTLPEGGSLDARSRRSLSDALGPASARGVVSIKIWSPAGTIVHATDPHLVGRSFTSDDLGAALGGAVVSSRTSLGEEENAYERAFASELIETYIPIRRAETDQVIAVAEFYQRPDLLEAELQRARISTWAVIAGATALMYVLLAGMVRAGSDTIEGQRRTLTSTVAELSRTARRLREVGAARAETEEALRRRVARELHDGLAQDLAAALVALPRADGSLARAGIESALAEVRSLATGMALPDLERLSVAAVVDQACRDHERKTGRSVTREIGPLPEGAAHTLKIAVYRTLQEALSNALRHAPGALVRVRASADAHALLLTCDDEGPGIAADARPGLGLRGMRERIELLGGTLDVHRGTNSGTAVRASIPLAQ